jgi:hypothetical protein
VPTARRADTVCRGSLRDVAGDGRSVEGRSVKRHRRGAVVRARLAWMACRSGSRRPHPGRARTGGPWATGDARGSGRGGGRFECTLRVRADSGQCRCTLRVRADKAQEFNARCAWKRTGKEELHGSARPRCGGTQPSGRSDASEAHAPGLPGRKDGYKGGVDGGSCDRGWVGLLWQSPPCGGWVGVKRPTTKAVREGRRRLRLAGPLCRWREDRYMRREVCGGAFLTSG